MKIYGYEDALRDFGGKNGLELSIMKWASVVAYLKLVKEEIGDLTPIQAHYVDSRVSAQCGLCLQYDEGDCFACPLARNINACCKELFEFTDSLDEDDFNRLDIDKTIFLAQRMLDKLMKLSYYRYRG